MNHSDIRRALAERFDDLGAQTAGLPLAPRPYQIETLRAVAEWMSNPSGTPRAYIEHATGLGKTVLFAILIRASAGLRTLVVVPTKTLVEQTVRMIAPFVGGMVGHLSSLKDVRNAEGEVIATYGLDSTSIVVTTDASFNRFARRIARQFNPHLIIRDECHWGYTSGAIDGLQEFPNAVTIGFSATPDYLSTVAKSGSVPVQLENGQILYGTPNRFAATHFGTRLDFRSVCWGIENGWLAPLAWGTIDFDISLDSLPTKEGMGGLDYDGAALQRLMSQNWPVLCETIRRLYAESDYDLSHRQVYAICPGVTQAEELARSIASLGISTACVTSKTPDKQREILLSAYRANEIRFIASVMILREGWDAPNAEVCMMLRPTKSRVLYVQGMGRVLRPGLNGVSKTALVLDVHALKSRFAPLSAPSLLGAIGTEVAERDILVGYDEDERPGKKRLSPYLPEHVQPKLVVVSALKSEHWADENACFQADGETWISTWGLEKRGLAQHDIWFLTTQRQDVRSRQGFTRLGAPSSFYAWSDIEKSVRTCWELMSCTTQFVFESAASA